MYKLTLGDIQKAKNKHRFIAVRSGARVFGINCAVPVSCPPGDEKKLSPFSGLYPISFSEYIRIKVPFVVNRFFINSNHNLL